MTPTSRVTDPGPFAELLCLSFLICKMGVMIIIILYFSSILRGLDHMLRRLQHVGSLMHLPLEPLLFSVSEEGPRCQAESSLYICLLLRCLLLLSNTPPGTRTFSPRSQLHVYRMSAATSHPQYPQGLFSGGQKLHALVCLLTRQPHVPPSRALCRALDSGFEEMGQRACLLPDLEKGQKKSPENITRGASVVRSGGASRGRALRAG